MSYLDKILVPFFAIPKPRVCSYIYPTNLVYLQPLTLPQQVKGEELTTPLSPHKKISENIPFPSAKVPDISEQVTVAIEEQSKFKQKLDRDLAMVEKMIEDEGEEGGGGEGEEIDLSRGIWQANTE